MLWIGSRLSTLERLSIASFLANGHPVHLYAYEAIEGVPHGTTIRDGNEILPAASIFTYPDGFGRGSPAAFANLFRYKLLLEHGGTWADTDMVCVQPLDFLASSPYVFASQRNPPQLVAESGPKRMNVVPVDVFCPVDFWNVPALVGPALRLPAETRAVHLWNAMWRHHGMDKDAAYDGASLYERLKARYLA